MAKRIFLAVILVLPLILFLFCTQRGQKIVVLQEIDKPTEIFVKAPPFPFRNGDLYVICDGQLDGEAKLEIISNNGRDTSEIRLSENGCTGIWGGSEYWVDDLKVKYVPISTKKGRLKVALICGVRSRGDLKQFKEHISTKSGDEKIAQEM